MVRRAIGRFPVSTGRVAIVAAILAIAGIGPVPAQSPTTSLSTVLLRTDSAVSNSIQAAGAAADQPPNSRSATAGFDDLAAQLDAIEKDVPNDTLTEEGLVELRRRLSAVQVELRESMAQLDQLQRQIDAQVAQLGPPLQNGEKEDAAIASNRSHLAAQKADSEAGLKQMRLLTDRADDLDRRISERRRVLFANRLLTGSANLFDATFWKNLAEALEAEWRGLKGVASTGWVYAKNNSSLGGVLAAAMLLAVLGGAVLYVLRWERRLLARPTPQRFDRALAAVLLLLFNAATWPALIVAATLVLRNFGLMQPVVVDIAMGLASAVAVAGFGRGVATGLFAPTEPSRRFIACSDRAAANCTTHLIWATGVLGLTVLISAVQRAAGERETETLIIANGETFSLLILGIMAHFLWRFAPDDPRLPETNLPETAAAEGRGFAWFRGVLLIAAVAIAAALATGYPGLALLIAGRITAALAVGGAVVIVTAFIDATFTELLASERPYGRRAGTLLGLAPRGVDLVATLMSALLRLVVIVLAALFLLGYSGLYTDDLSDLFRRVQWEFAIGGVSVSPSAVLTALAFAIAGALAIRGAQRWLETKFLPRTGLDASLQNSALTLFGYAGAIAVLALALTALGIDLQKIALIAGALSVGIGFGLQSVVSNFVSGLILLAERPIRVGDWVVVKNEEGWVRRISVRATEIETFDRATVIIPNQEFITGVVKNWTHGNSVGRIIVKVRVTYDCDLRKVRDILAECAANHPDVLRVPPPVAFLIGFGDIGVDFELRCILGNIEQSLAVRSDIQIEVLRRFGEAGIKIPFPDHKEQPPGPRATSAPSSKTPNKHDAD